MKSSLIYSYQIDNKDGHRTFMESLDQILCAEDYGFDSVLVSEHHLVENGYFPAPFVTMGAIAARTKKLRIGSGVILLPLYNPLHVAEHGAVLDIISNGRFILGVGQGYRQEEFDAFQIDLKERSSRLREGVEAIRKLWTETTMSFRAKHFVYENVALSPLPKQKPHPPIWIAAKKRAAVRLAAQVGDAWFADPVTPLAVLAERMADYRTALRELGRPDAGFDFPLMREVYCGETDESAWSEAKDHVLELYREYLEWGHMQDDDGRPVAPGDERALALLRNRFIIGSPETCVRECKKYERALGVTNMIMRMKSPGLSHERVMNSIKLWGEEVMPEIGC